jgi:predicted NBD/HSP70 family sugar kinase
VSVPATATTPKLLRRMNAHVVLDALREPESLRVSDLVTATGLSRPTIDAVADDLIRLGWVTEVGRDAEAPATRGRPARRLAFRADAGYVAGLDIGERKVRLAIADLRGDVLEERRQDFDEAANGKQRLAQIRRLAKTSLAAAGIRRDALLASCVGCTGAMDAARGAVLFTTAFPGIERLNLRTALSGALGKPILVENDCNLAVIGERWRGVARGVDDAICVLASERLGAGIVVGGQLVRGHAGAAGEMAFLGAYEERHGAEGIAQLARTLARDAARRGAPDGQVRRDRAGGDSGDIEAETVFAAARAGDPAADAIIEESIRSAGRAIVTMALVLNPELVVIGGGVARAGDVLLGPLRRQLDQMARLPPRLEASSLAERGPLVGAIRHALDEVEPRLLDGLHQAA